MTVMTRNMLVFNTIVLGGTFGTVAEVVHLKANPFWSGLGTLASYLLARGVLSWLDRRHAARIEPELREIVNKYNNQI